MSKTLEQKLCDRSLGYAFVRNFFVTPAFYLFYRKVDVIGAKDVPDKGPVIFTPNHQNALMDALSILCTKNRQPVFVARADIFQKPLIVAALHFLRILPIFRKRDGGNSVDNNQETFDMILKVLHSQQAVGIMPEGVHNEIKRLGILQKGILRLAMQAQAEHGNRPMVKIVPVGLEYTNYNKFRSDVIIRYGKAIELSDFYDQYVENPARTFKQIQSVLSEKMKEGMINIINDQHYSEIERLRVLYQKQAAKRLGLKVRKAEDRLQAQQKIVTVLQNYDRSNPNEMTELCLATKKYLDILHRYDFRDWVVKRQPYPPIGLLVRGILALIGIPFWILGMLFNYAPYKLSAWASRKIKDPQFITSIQFVAGLVLFPLYHFIMIVLLVIFVPCVWGKIIMPLLILPLGSLAFRYFLSLRKLDARFRFWVGTWTKNPEILHTIELRKDIFEKMEKISFE